MDPRIPDASTAWQLWHTDTFDRDAPPSLQTSGEDIRRGLYELWLYTLREGIQANGNASFSYFHLAWGSIPSTRVDVAVQPFHNSALLKLRQWTHLRDQNRSGIPEANQHGQEQGISILNRVAQLHHDLLLKSDRWDAATIDWSAEARELLARVELLRSPEEF